MSELTDIQKERLERNRQLIEQQQEQQELLRLRMGKIKHKIAVISGKGGVGKSTITVNLAASFRQSRVRRRGFGCGYSWAQCAAAVGVNGAAGEGGSAGCLPRFGSAGHKSDVD